MTGILPIKKDGTQSAISDFEEYSMLAPWPYSEYVGFTQKEVELLCQENECDFDKMRQWYDGYTLKGAGSIYNPNSVMKAVRYHSFRSYWTETSASQSLMDYISREQVGLSKTIAGLIGGLDAEVDTNGFANDLITFKNQDDILTLLVHLGYLTYNEDTKKVSIPNEEVRMEFSKAVREVKSDETQKRVSESDRLIYDTVHMNAE